jgi:hypothetical protein
LLISKRNLGGLQPPSSLLLAVVKESDLCFRRITENDSTPAPPQVRTRITTHINSLLFSRQSFKELAFDTFDHHFYDFDATEEFPTYFPSSLTSFLSFYVLAAEL